MKFALIDDTLAILNEHTYDRIPAWRVLAARGRVRCPGCGGALRVVAPVSREPFFQHADGPACPLEGMAAPPAELTAQAGLAATAAPDAPSPDSSGEERWAGPFRLPRHRSIDAERSEPPAERKAYRLVLAPRRTIRPLARLAPDALHPKQRLAVETTEGPLLILAGAGSGKTRVMTARTAHLIGDKGVDPRTVMVVTFTAKAAEEIRRRLARQLRPDQVSALICGTFHSLFYRMLVHHDPARWDQRRLLKQDWEKIRFLKECGALRELAEAPCGEAELEQALAAVSRWKNEFLMPDDAALLTAESPEERLARTLYPVYEEAKRRHGRFDFDDMLIGCHQLLAEHETIRRRYQERIAYVMIDEFQDINRVQYEVVKLLAAPQNNLCAIGDDDQSIYGFRGSDPSYILGFARDFPEARTITLDVNYRSRSSIVSLGYSLIAHNRSRWNKEFVAYHPEEGESYLFYPEDEEEQASRIVDEIALGLAEGASPDQYAILFRTYESTRPLAERLTEAGIPFSLLREEEPFYRKTAVRWALAYLRLALRPDDEEALRELWPTLYLSADHYNGVRSQAILSDVTLLDALPLVPGVKPFQRKHLEKAAEILRQLPGCSPAQALELVLEDLKLRDYVKKRARARNGTADERAADELRQLLVAARRHLTLPEFLRHVNQMLANEREVRATRQPGEGGVQLLSMHRAKGLEFDTVFVVDLVEGALPHEYALDQLRQGRTAALEEERRLLYVAITRARRRLAIGVPLERFGRKTRPSRFIAEMGRAVSPALRTAPPQPERTPDGDDRRPEQPDPAEAHPISRHT